MDELAAAAAVVGTTSDTNADHRSEQRAHCGADSVALAPMEGVESPPEGKENDGDHAAATLHLTSPYGALLSLYAFGLNHEKLSEKLFRAGHGYNSRARID